jgi:hypothetical protein
MLPDENEPTLSTIMLKYKLLKDRLAEIRSVDPYTLHRGRAGNVLILKDYLE